MQRAFFLASLTVACLALGAATTEKQPSAPPGGRFVNVVGAVHTPGPVLMRPTGEPFTIMDAIASAGGATRLAELRAVRVTRRVTIEVDVTAMLKARDPSALLPLENGDVILVPLRP